MTEARACIRNYIEFFEQLELTSLDRLEDLFSEDATFQDPFNAVSGRRAIRRVFEHMFQVTRLPRFQVLDWMTSGPSAFLRWRFTCEVKGSRIDVVGVSHVTFDQTGRAIMHVDYWDPAQAIYEKLPLLGRLIRRLRLHIAV